MLVVVISLISTALETIPSLEAQYGRWFIGMELLSLVLFTVEYLARVWVAVEHAPDRHLTPARARLKFVTSPAGIIDLLAVLPFWLGLPFFGDLRSMLEFRSSGSSSSRAIRRWRARWWKWSTASGAPCSAASCSCSAPR